ncbi:hypothetical protein CUC44_01390 [Aeromonas lusitana]|uniref:Uncharacterized protein n=1 Tax=Aeromonas lusitana TaxID=931529 RepID=A0A2M8HEV6_9GAMM|nr:hypothetical protein CUC44_01390 [Aeromonas lusitana]
MHEKVIGAFNEKYHCN